MKKLFSNLINNRYGKCLDDNCEIIDQNRYNTVVEVKKEVAKAGNEYSQELIHSTNIEQIMKTNQDLFVSRDLRDSKEKLDFHSDLKDREKVKQIIKSIPDIHNNK